MPCLPRAHVRPTCLSYPTKITAGNNATKPVHVPDNKTLIYCPKARHDTLEHDSVKDTTPSPRTNPMSIAWTPGNACKVNSITTNVAAWLPSPNHRIGSTTTGDKLNTLMLLDDVTTPRDTRCKHTFGHCRLYTVHHLHPADVTSNVKIYLSNSKQVYIV